MGSLLAGATRITINPPVGVDLCGYAARNGSNIGVHDDLHAKALVISDGATRAAVVTLDLIGLNAEQVAHIRSKAGAESGILPGNILIASSHTHSGPASQVIRACGGCDHGYVESLLEKISSLIVQASRELRPARFSYGKSQAAIAINRRYRGHNAEIPADDPGVVDPEVGIWHFTDHQGEPIATLFNYAAHAVVLGGDNLLVSADWPGAAQRVIERRVGGQAMFLQGCCGDINPRERGSFEIVEKLGAEVADAVMGGLARLESPADPTIRIKSEIIQLPLLPAASVEEARRVERECVESLEKADENTDIGSIHIWEGYRDWARIVISMNGHGEQATPMEIQKFSIDDAHIIALPGEVFVEYALNMKQMKPNIMVAGYANGNVGYVPTAAAFDQGGYEIDCAYRLYAVQQFSPDVEKAVINAARRLLA